MDALALAAGRRRDGTPVRFAGVAKAADQSDETSLRRERDLECQALPGEQLLLFATDQVLTQDLLLVVEQRKVVGVGKSGVRLQLIEPEHDRRRATLRAGIGV